MMILKNNSICLIFILYFNLSYSQINIKGKITEFNDNKIQNCNIVLKDNIGKIITYTYTNVFGEYKLKIDNKGQFVLIASSIGFEQKSKDLTFEDKNEIKIIDFVLTPKATELKEIIIENKIFRFKYEIYV